MPYVWTLLAAVSTAILWMGNNGHLIELSLSQSYIVSIVYAICAITALCYAMKQVEYTL